MPRKKAAKLPSSGSEFEDEDLKSRPSTRRATRQSARQTKPIHKLTTTENSDESSSDEDQPPPKKPTPPQKNKKIAAKTNASSSESDIENYLKPTSKIDLNSSFFNSTSPIGNKIAEMKEIQLSESSDNSSVEESPSKKIKLNKEVLEPKNEAASKSPLPELPKLELKPEEPSNYNFQQFIDYTTKLEETKQQIEKINKTKKKRKKSKLKEDDILKLLKAGESSKLPEENMQQLEAELDSSDFESCDSEKEDWEEVKPSEKRKKSLIPKKNIEITINDMPQPVKKKKGQNDIFMAMKRRLNRIKKENQVYMHKVHVLGWIAHGNYVSSIINRQEVLAQALSMLPSDKCYPPNRTDLKYLEGFVHWFRRTFESVDKAIPENLPLEVLLKKQMKIKQAYNHRMLVFIFAAILRALGIQCRLVFSFQVLPLRPPAGELFSLSTRTENDKTDVKFPVRRRSNAEKDAKMLKNLVDSKKKTKNKTEEKKTEMKIVENGRNTRSKAKQDRSNDSSTKAPEEKKKEKKSLPKKPNLSSLSTSSPPKATSTQTSPSNPKRSKYFGSGKSLNAFDIRNTVMDLISNRINEVKDEERRRRSTRQRKPIKSSHVDDDDNDEDEIPVPSTSKPKITKDNDFVVPSTKVKRRVNPNPEGLDDGKKNKRTTFNVWIEVYLEEEENWISVDVYHGEVHCLKKICTRASHPISYIVAWSNNNAAKDLTRRYCENFNTITRKLRAESAWWEKALAPFEGVKTVRDREEDDDLEKKQFDQPLPTSITEYKNHPLYVLKRHLLKFEVLYPAEIQPLGFVRKEEVYPRRNVYICHSREVWLKHAKTVKPGEKPYKIVKARPKYDKLSSKLITDQLLEIFGPWQTQDYDPPTAENGVVPRNAYGNVELFKECMLPKKTVHLKLPGLNKVARKLQIDCASAVTGFDFHGGFNHAVYDGYVVCEEFKEVLTAAWEEEQGEIEKRELEKVEKRVYGNWRKLIKGLWIRERLQNRYGMGGAAAPTTSATSAPNKKKSRKK